MPKQSLAPPVWRGTALQQARTLRYNQPMAPTNPQTITIDGVTLTLVVERKRVKNINARLRETTLSVSAPLNTPQSTLDKVIPDLARRLVRRVHARQVN